MNVETQQNEAEKPQGKAKDVDEGERFVLHQLAEGYFKMIKKHGA